MDDMIAFSPMDQDGSDISRPEMTEAFELVDAKINDAILTRDIRILVNQIAVLRKGAKIVGLSLVRVLGRIAENWEVFGINEPMQDYLEAETGLHPATIDRYIKVYNMLQIAPPEVLPRLTSMNVKNLIPIGNMVAQGWQLEQKEWQELADAADYNDIAAKTRKMKGAEPRKSGLRLWMNRQGEVYAFKNTEDGKNAERRFICVLPTTDTDPIVQQAVERLIKNAGVLLQ